MRRNARYTVRISHLPTPASITALAESMRTHNRTDARAMRALAAVIDRVASHRIDARYVTDAMREIDSIGGTDAVFRTVGFVATGIGHAADTVAHRIAYADACRVARIVSAWGDSDVERDVSVSFARFDGTWARPTAHV